MSTDAKLIEKKDILLARRIWYFIMGRLGPGLLTRIFLVTALVFFFYYAGWNIFRYFAITHIQALDHPEPILQSLQNIGYRYGITDAAETFTELFLALSVTQIMVIPALILIYRKIRAGYWLYLAAQISFLFCPLFLVNSKYFTDEIDMTDKIIPGILFTTALLLYLRLSSVVKSENDKSSSAQ